MKTVILCIAGFLIGISVASFTQKPVMESLGYWPEQEVVAKASAQQPSYAQTSFEREEFTGTTTIDTDFDEVMVFPNAAEAEVASAPRTRAVVRTPPVDQNGGQSGVEEPGTPDVGESSPTLPMRIKNSFVSADSRQERNSETKQEADANEEANANGEAIADVAEVASKQPVETQVNAEVASKDSITTTDSTEEHEAEMDTAGEVPATAKQDSTVSPTETRVVAAKPPIKSVEEAVTPPADAAPPADVAKEKAESAEPESIVKKAEAEGETESEEDLFTGSWRVVSAKHRGRGIPSEITAKMSVEFKDAQILFKAGSRTEQGNFVLETDDDETSKYSSMRIDSPSGKKPAIKGVYHFDGNTLFMVWGAPGAETPNPESDQDLEKARVLELQRMETK